MYGNIKDDLINEIETIKSNGLYKNERIITSKQGANISTTTQEDVLNFCANNYLGLASNSEVIEAGVNAIKNYGFGLSSVRFICGTQDIHKELEQKTAQFLGMEDCILYAAAFDANGPFTPLGLSQRKTSHIRQSRAAALDNCLTRAPNWITRSIN